MFAYFRKRKEQRDANEKERGRQYAKETITVQGKENGISHLEAFVDCSRDFNTYNAFDSGIVEYLQEYHHE